MKLEWNAMVWVVTPVIRVLSAIGWTVAALFIMAVLTIPAMLLIDNTPMSWFWTLFGNNMGELIFAAVFECAMSLILLFVTRRVRSLNRSMIWVLAGWAVWLLLNAPLPLLGMKTIGLGSYTYHFYNTIRLGGWFYAIGLLVKAVSILSSISLYLLWERHRNRHKPDSISAPLLFSVLRAIGWTVAALLIIPVFTVLLMTLIDNTSMSWFWTLFGIKTGELIFVAGFNCTISLILLFATRPVRSLNRSMIWVLAGFTVWPLLNAPLPMLGMVPIGVGCGSYNFHNTIQLGGWFYSIGLLIQAVSRFVGIALYLFWERTLSKPRQT